MSEPPSAPHGSRPIFIAELEQLGGAERSVLALARWLHARNLPAYILTYHDHCALASFADFPLDVVSLQPMGGVRAKVSALRRHLASRPANDPQMLVSGYQPALHATLVGQRGFHTLMHDTPSLFGDENTRSAMGSLRIVISSLILRYGLHTGGHTFVNSEYLREECRHDFGITATIARMGGLQSTAPAADHQRTAGTTLRLLSVCRVQHNKRLDWLLEGLATLQRQRVQPLRDTLEAVTPWRFDIVGQGDQVEPLRQQAADLGIAEHVHFHGFLPDADVETLYARAHLFLMPARQGYGIPAVEAITRGLPVLLHRESGVSDMLLQTPWATVLHGGCADTAAALATAIAGVLQNAAGGVAPPDLPTESVWAEGIATACGWL